MQSHLFQRWPGQEGGKEARRCKYGGGLCAKPWRRVQGSEGIKTKGYIQGYLSLMEIPYVSSSPFATMLATNKFFCKNYLRYFNIKTPEGLKISNKHDIPFSQIAEKIGFPCIVKPNIGTDSIGVKKVEAYEDLESSIFSLLEKGDEVQNTIKI